MKQYILRRYVDHHVPGTDVTGLYPIEDLEKFVTNDLARAIEEPAAEMPVALDDLTPNAVEPVTAPATKKRK